MIAQPRGLYLINFISMWECFSYYGMRALLVLFMVQELAFNDSEAFALYALYITLIEFGGLIGGVIADRLLGLKRSIAMGGLTIVLGHTALAFNSYQEGFYLGLGLIVAGTALFRSNIAAFLGQFYGENDPRRDSGYVIYYTGINVGSFLASLSCGLVAELYGWEAGFGLAALGMLSGILALLLGYQLLPQSEGQKKGAAPLLGGLAILGLLIGLATLSLTYMSVSAMVFPFLVALGMLYFLWSIKDCSTSDLKQFRRLALYILSLVIFYGCEEQLGSSLVLFAERHVDREFLWGTIPATALIMFNPLTILMAGPLFLKLLKKWEPRDFSKLMVSYLFLASSFGLLWICSLRASEGEVGLFPAISSIVLIGLGEILIGPLVLAFASKTGPQSLRGVVMGMVTFGFSLANLVSGWLSQLMAVVDENSSLSTYVSGFGYIGAGLAAVTLVFVFIVMKSSAKLVWKGSRSC